MATRKTAVIEMADREDQGGRHCKQLIRRCPHPGMHYGCADGQQQEPDRAAQQHADPAVPAESQAECQDTDRDHQQKHLLMKMLITELCSEWQQTEQNRQCQAMQQAQAGQRNGGTVQCGVCFGLAVIHAGLP
jgi:hypothetical protein